MYRILQNNKKEKGVTLVALVVTIIVLLILAFIAISILMGDNGIVKKAEESREETIKAQEREYIKLAYQDLEMEYRLNGTDITADRVMEKLQEYDSNIKVEMITKDEIGDTEIVVEKNSGEEYAEIVYTETNHKYAGSLVIDTNKARYEVIYNANRGSGGPTKQVKIEGTPLIITSEIPERKGYNFIGWARESTAVVAEYLSGSQYTEDANITLYAVWQLRADIDPVAQIGSTKYPSIQEAIYDCSKEGGETSTTIILLKNTEEEFTTFEGQNIILDLQGHIVTSESEGALCTNNGKLQIINGSLSSNKGTSILNNGEIIIGDNSTGIDDNTPTIYGNKVGIDNKGTFNYYDGKIQGIVPIQGTTTSTPDQYGPVQTGYENGISTIQLRILTQYEARIGWVYYETLQGAIDIAKAKETVTLIKDLQLKEILQVGETKDVILDLYGYELTVASGLDTVIKNYGNLEIKDNSAEQTGNITITSTSYCYGIRNEGEKTLRIAGGTINSNNNSGSYHAYTIYNESSGAIEISGGTVNSSCNYFAYAIYNKSIGSIEVTEGTVSSSGGMEGYGIYNKNIGKIEITGGTINSSDCGISNTGSGNVEITGGIISSDCGISNTDSGTVTITGGTVSSNRYGIRNTSSGNIKITGGTVSSNTSYNVPSYGIYNQNTGTIEISGGIVNSNSNSSSYGIYNYSSGSIEVTGGSVSTSSISYSSYGIYNTGSGTVIIGIKENEIIQKENPKIIGEYLGTSTSYKGYGIYNGINGEFEFYNGIIQGNIALSGVITNIRDEYKVEESIINELESIYLVEKTNIEYIVQIDETKYYSLKEAIESIGEEEKIIQLLRNFELEEIVEFNKNIILDLNGYTITNKYYEISNIGDLTITDSTEDKQGKIECLESIIGIKNNKNGNLNISGVTVSSNSFRNSYGIYNNSAGSIEVTGGIVNSSISTGDTDSYGIYNASIGNIEVTGGTVSSNRHGIYNASSGNIKVTGGTITGNSNGIYNSSTGTVEVTGGTIDSNLYGIHNTSSGNIKITGGTISSSKSKSSAYGIYNASSGIVEITGGIVSTSSNVFNSYGIYNLGSGTIIVGIKGDGLVSQEEPYIKGEKNTGTSTKYGGYGIYNTKGKLYFYDGKIEGTTKAVYEIITEKEENTEFNYNKGETILTLLTGQSPMAQIGDVIYYDLQEAINSTTEEDNTIKILRNVTYTIDNPVITIPNTKNIILDLNGYKITSAIIGKTIQNVGTLEITDTSEGKTGLITTVEETTIYNASGAELIISEGTIENINKYAINNEGKLIIYEGVVNGIYGIYNTSDGNVEVLGGIVGGNNSGSSYGIYNASSGSIKVIGGTVSSSNYGIYNNGSGTVKVTGGTVSSSSNYSNSYGIYNKSTGILVIGIKGDGLISQEHPIIKSKEILSSTYYAEYGIYNPNGTLYYYDGKIQGGDNAISGNITDIEDSTEINLSEETVDGNVYKTITLNQIITNVARVNGTEYDSIQKAIEACGEVENTIELLRGSNPGSTIIIGENQNITIDLKGHTINNYTELQNNGTLKIIDTSSEQTGKIVGLTETAVSNTGMLEIQSGTISASTYGIKNTRTLTLNGGTITNNAYGIYNDSKGTINIKEGNFISNTYGIYNNSNTIANINGGNISSNTYGIYNYSSSSITNINEGTITSNEYGIYNYNGTTNIGSKGITNNTYGVYVANGTVTVKEGAEIQSETGIYVSSGTLNIGETGTMNPDSPIIIGETYGLTVSGAGKVYMYDGQVKGKTGATEGYITYTEEGYVVANKTEEEYFVDYLALGGTANAVAQVNGVSYSTLQSAINSITGGEEQTIILLNGIVSTETYTITEGQNIKLDMNGKTITSEAEETINNSGNLTIMDTSGKNVAKITSTTGIAIINSGTLTLGEDEGTVIEGLITIEGKTVGIENTGELNFYDGAVIGTTAINGDVKGLPTGYTITTNTVSGKQKATLTQ